MVAVDPGEHASPDRPYSHLLAGTRNRIHRLCPRDQNLLPDVTGTPLRHPQIGGMFKVTDDGNYQPLFMLQPH